MTEQKKRLSRRNFLLTVGASGAVSAAAVLAKKTPQGEPNPGNADRRATRGYQVTPHVTDYYRTAKV